MLHSTRLNTQPKNIYTMSGHHQKLQELVGVYTKYKAVGIYTVLVELTRLRLLVYTKVGVCSDSKVGLFNATLGCGASILFSTSVGDV